MRDTQQICGAMATESCLSEQQNRYYILKTIFQSGFPTWNVMGARAALIWLVGVRASIRPDGIMLWGVWRATDDTCLDT